MSPDGAARALAGALLTECCGTVITVDQRFCSTCGWEARAMELTGTPEDDDILDRRLGELQRYLSDERHDTWAGFIMTARTRLKMLRDEVARLRGDTDSPLSPFRLDEPHR